MIFTFPPSFKPQRASILVVLVLVLLISAGAG
jgi:hypothetical protein